MFIGKTILICIDGKSTNTIQHLTTLPLDCWDREHHHCFDVIDKQTNSMLLVSTRISGLISNNACTEVKLSLMSVQVSMHVIIESVD